MKKTIENPRPIDQILDVTRRNFLDKMATIAHVAYSAPLLLVLNEAQAASRPSRKSRPSSASRPNTVQRRRSVSSRASRKSRPSYKSRPSAPSRSGNDRGYYSPTHIDATTK